MFLFLVLFSLISIVSTDDSINLLVRSSINPTIRRYCVDLAKLPNGLTINVTNFGWHNPYLASPTVNACNVTDLENSLPSGFPLKTILIIYEHGCKITEHAWNVETLYGKNISLMVLTNRTNTHYELTYNTTSMPVSIPVLVFVQSDFNKMNNVYGNISDIEMSIDYALDMPKKFRPAILLMFVLVFVILICGNHWAANEFQRKVIQEASSNHSDSTSLSVPSTPNDFQDSILNNVSDETALQKSNKKSSDEDKAPRNSEPAIIYMPYCIIALILCFAVGWLLLIYYFPKVMIYILQGKFIIEIDGFLFQTLFKLFL